METRKVRKVIASRPTEEGAGVRLYRAIGGEEPPEQYDPFLLLDDFRSDTPADYVAGFPWHPHRGMETITYVLKGEAEHQDSLGNKGVIGPGDLQWMSAGSGIVHQEMPRGDENGAMHGFQLWANLPAALKMAEPRYRDVRASDIPRVKDAGGALVKVIAGNVNGVQGAVRDVAADPEYLDVTLPGRCTFVHPTKRGHTVFAYVILGEVTFDERGGTPVGNRRLVSFADGDAVSARAGDGGVRFLLVSGKPIGEPIAWRGPIVMNTQAELRVALEEIQRGTFIKHAKGGGERS
jgi:redox-sensitive bicupin YhaK (pirin superfamily)